jgi:antitoxin YefM
MESIECKAFEKKLKYYMNQVNNEAQVIAITNGNAEDAVVMLSKKEYDAMYETLRVLSNEYLHEKIRKGDNQFKAKQFTIRELISED